MWIKGLFFVLFFSLWLLLSAHGQELQSSNAAPQSPPNSTQASSQSETDFWNRLESLTKSLTQESKALTPEYQALLQELKKLKEEFSGLKLSHEQLKNAYERLEASMKVSEELHRKALEAEIAKRIKAEAKVAALSKTNKWIIGAAAVCGTAALLSLATR